MSGEAARIADQLERAYNGEAWHGPSLRELLRDVTARAAATRVIPDVHSIWELTEHITFWIDAVHRRLGPTPYLPADGSDWRAIPPETEARWRDVLSALDRAHTALVAAVRSLSDDDLNRTVPGKGYTVYVMLHGSVQHTIYHAGQIAIQRRAAMAAS